MSYVKKVVKSWQEHFSDLIQKNQNNPRILFSTIDSLINPPSQYPGNFFSNSKCSEFSAYFRDKVSSIRSNITHSSPHTVELTPVHCNSTLDHFTLVDLEMVSKVVSGLKSSTCSLDPIPTSFFKTVFNCLSGELLVLLNQSLLTGTFPKLFKTAIVKPILKRATWTAKLLAIIGLYQTYLS